MKKILLLFPMVLAISYSLIKTAESKEDARSRLKAKLRKPDAIDQKFVAANNWKYAMRNNGSFMFDTDDLDHDGNRAGGQFPRTENKTLIWAGGMYIASLKNGIPVCSEVEFSSEFQPGRILNTAIQFDSLVAENPNDPKQRVFFIDPDHPDNEWPSDAMRDMFNRPALVADAQTWVIFNDRDTSLSQEQESISPNPGLGIEVVMESFVWNVGTLSDAVIFKLKISNKTNATYSQSYLGIWMDADVDRDHSTNDIVGCDTARGLGFVYNSDNSDEIQCAVGIDFLQGPQSHISELSIKDAQKFSGNTSQLQYDPVRNIFSPTEIMPGFVHLGATAFVTHAGSTDPITNEQRYYLLKGLFADSNIKTGRGYSDYYMFRGDPLTAPPGDPNIHASPGDQRILHCAGPFTLPADSSQEIWFAVIGAKGTDRLDAVRQLFKTDDVIQSVFNQGLVTPQPPEMPHLSVTTLDNRVVLSWQNNAEYSEDIAGDVFHITTDSGYSANYIQRDFQGYRVYRSLTGLDGSFALLVQYDKIDSLGIISNRTINAEGHLEIEDIDLGSNTGLRYSYIDTDVKNGYQYFYSVTAYDAQPYIATSELITIDGLTIQKPAGIPVSLESSLLANRVQAFPMKPIASVQYDAVSDSSAEHMAGGSDGFVNLEVIDPLAVTGDDYRIEFFNISDTIHGYSPMLAYKVINVTLQQPAMFSNRVDDPETFWDYNHDGIYNGSDQPFDERYFNTIIATPDDTTSDEEFGIVDGILLKIFEPPLKVKSWSYSPGNGTGVRWFTGGHIQPYYFEQFFGSLTVGRNFPGSSLSRDSYRNVDIVFSTIPSEWQIAYSHRLLSDPPDELFLVPFTVFEVDSSDDDPSPRPLNVIVRDFNDLDGWYLDNYQGGDYSGPQTRSYIYITNRNYDAGALDTAIWDKPIEETPIMFTMNFAPSTSEALDWNELVKNALLSGSDGGNTITLAEQENIYTQIPDDGTFHIFANHVLSATDMFEYSTKANSNVTGKKQLKKALKDILVVPNPFYIFSQFKSTNDNKEIKFTKLPASCSIKIFTVSGDLVKIIYHNASSNNNRIDPTVDSDINDAPALDSSTESWNLTNHRGKLVASGMYIALVEAPGIGKTTVKFAVIQ